MADTEEIERRRRLYWELHDFGQGHGLEIGPLHRPLVPRGQADVRYLDVKDRDALVEWYSRMDPDVVVEDIPDIDYHLIQADGRTLTLAEASAPGAPYDWVMASHVIEHVPDLIGWLAEIAEVVADDGALVLAVPDKRYTFDAYRPLTTVGQMVDAHLSGDRRPSVRAVYDYFSGRIDYNHESLWRGERPFYDAPRYSAADTEAQLAATRRGEYVDAHVWLWTPDHFLRQLHELRVTGRSVWIVDRMVETPRDDIEFRVRLRRLPRAADPTAEQDDEILAEGERPEWVERQAGWHQRDNLEYRIGELERFLEEAEAQATRLRRQVRRRTARVRALKARVAELEDSSRKGLLGRLRG